ncbi:hypothetical protein ABIE44_003609 [Marmoricola sp. OAE513]
MTSILTRIGAITAHSTMNAEIPNETIDSLSLRNRRIASWVGDRPSTAFSVGGSTGTVVDSNCDSDKDTRHLFDGIGRTGSTAVREVVTTAAASDSMPANYRD